MKKAKPNSVINLEEFLRNNNFELDTYYHTNKRYMKRISEYQNLYVRIFSDINEIVSVEYENNPITQYDSYNLISFDTIETVDQLKKLIKAFTPVDGKCLFTCDICGEEKVSKKYTVVDENFNKQNGISQCEDCYKSSVLN